MKLPLKLLIAGLVAVAVLASIVFIKPEPASPDYNSVLDSSIGLSFNVPKNFQPIAKDELSVLNPGFAYGYRPATDARTACFVSTSSLKGSGVVTTKKLTDGILKEVRKNHPRAKAISVATVDYGQAKGIFLRISYADGNTKYSRFEALGLGKKSQVIAYCQTLDAYVDQYRPNFDTLFASLKLNS